MCQKIGSRKDQWQKQKQLVGGRVDEEEMPCNKLRKSVFYIARIYIHFLLREVQRVETDDDDNVYTYIALLLLIFIIGVLLYKSLHRKSVNYAIPYW